MPVGPVHHRRDGEKKIAGFRRFFCHFRLLRRPLHFSFLLDFRPFVLIFAATVLQRNTTAVHAVPRIRIFSKRSHGSTGYQVLRAIKTYDIADKKGSEITSTDVIAFANQPVIKVTPQTVSSYLSHSAAVFAVAKPAWGYPLDRTGMNDAFLVAKRLAIASKSRERDRRPALDELDKILQHLGERRKRRPSSIPMRKVIGFSVLTPPERRSRL